MSLLGISTKSWFGFDLDDTLHEFRRASALASDQVFQAVHTAKHIKINALKDDYRVILRNATANAFTDGRTSAEYRRERFDRLLQMHGVNEPRLLECLLEVYHDSLRENLTLKDGALHLLQTLHKRGKNIIVITEGPADAQEWTVRELGIQPYIDVLVTTNAVGKSKVDGIFGVVLNKYDIATNEIVYFGDNPARDIEAARAEGILAVLYDTTGSTDLEDTNALRVNSWANVADILIRGE